MFALLVAGIGSMCVRGSETDGGDEHVRLDPLEVVAHPSGADERTASASVVHRDLLDVESPRLADLLAGVPGLHIDQPGGAGGRSTMYLRGGEENHTLVFLDGIPMNDLTNSRGGGFDLSLLEPAALETAAVVRGPSSVRYGPDAVAGVIHFETQSTVAATRMASLEAGGDGLGRAALQLGADVADEVSFSLGGAWTREDAARDAGGMERRFYNGAMRWTKAVEVRIAVWHLDQHSEGFPDDSGGERLAVIRDLERRDDLQTGVSTRVAGRSDDWTWSGSVDFARFDAGVVSPGVAPGVRDPQGLPASVDDTRLERTRLGFIVERPTGDWTVSGGADAQRERGSDDAVLDFGFFQLPAGFAMNRDRVGAFIEGVGRLGGPVTASAGLRVDHFDDGNSHATARVGLLGEVTEYTQWRINAGTGFKPPSFFALAHPLVGNPDLKAERSESIDAGVRHVFSEGRGLIDASVFTSRLNNGVDFDPGPPPRVANIAEIRTRGVELAASWRPGAAWDLFSSLTCMDARSEPDGARMRSRPHWRGGVGVRWLPREDLSALLRLTAVDRIPDSSIPTGDVWLPGWVRVDVSVRWQATDQIAIHVACDNLFDERYEEAVGFASPERRVRIGLQARF